MDNRRNDAYLGTTWEEQEEYTFYKTLHSSPSLSPSSQNLRLCPSVHPAMATDTNFSPPSSKHGSRPSSGKARGPCHALDIRNMHAFDAIPGCSPVSSER